MSGSSPSDLAVAFRSLPRRFAAAADDVDPAVTARAERELQAAIQRAATVIGAAADPEAVAQATESRPADDWTESSLDLLRAAALEAGAVIRRLEEQPRQHAADD